MRDSRPLIGLVLVVLLTLPAGSAITAPAGNVSDGATRVFISDDRDPDAGEVPPFVLADTDDIGGAETESLANSSRMRDFTYPTTQPSAQVGPDQQTLGEYRLAQLQSIERNDSTSLWLPDSQRSNGTVVKDAHITLLGTQEGTRTRFGSPTETRSGDEDEQLFIPRNGTALTYLDYSTQLPNETCTVSGDTKTCHNYTLLDQEVNRSVQIGTQTWSNDSEASRQLEYTGADATEPTTMEVRATITSTVDEQTTTYIQEDGDWKLANTTESETRTLSHTVQDSAPVVVTTNQNLSVTQTVVRSEEGNDRIILEFEAPQELEDRRLWSYAAFEDSTTRIQNVWGVYSQRQYTNATRGHARPIGSTAISEVSTTETQPNHTPAQQQVTTEPRRQTVAFPNVLELQLFAQSRQPSVQQTNAVSGPEVTRANGDNLSANAAPLEDNMNLTSVQPRGYSSIVVTNADQPITEVRDIHNDSIPLTTQTVSEQNASLSTTILNETHAQIQLSDASTDDPLSGRTLSLSGAAQGQVTTNADGIAVVERRDLYVTASFSGATNVSESTYYGPTQTQVEFQPDPFNIYQLLSSLAGALVSVAAFLLFFLPFAYMRGGTE